MVTGDQNNGANSESSLIGSVIELARRARSASRKMASAPETLRNEALLAIADALESGMEDILNANSVDIEAAKCRALPLPLIDRLTLLPDRIHAMAQGVREIAALPDPVGSVLSHNTRPNGIQIKKVRVPLGVIGIIYESRPNVTVDSAALCLKSGNAVILRGGSEAIHSNRCLAAILQRAAATAGLPADAAQIIQNTDRVSSVALMQAEGLVDLLIPRGGNGLKKTVLENARVPVLTSLGGVCHCYIDKDADMEMAANIAFNAKVSRPSVCNAMETLLVHSSVAPTLLAKLLPRYTGAGVEVRGCDKTRGLYSELLPASDEDWDTEYLALIVSIKIVESVEEAIGHIEAHGTRHSEAIVTNNANTARIFTDEVDAACVYVNASTRFTDGFEFGLGAEVGISTQKLHARGPIGPEELTTYKYIIQGTGQTR
jgi:glutamate-5-semialdehyde dehydrogenase